MSEVQAVAVSNARQLLPMFAVNSVAIAQAGTDSVLRVSRPTTTSAALAISRRASAALAAQADGSQIDLTDEQSTAAADIMHERIGSHVDLRV